MNYNLIYVGKMFNEILEILNREAPTWEIELGYTPTFVYKKSGIALPMYNMNTSDLIDISKYNIREIAKNIARSASELFLYRAAGLELEELGYRVDGASYSFNIGDVIWVKPRSEIWVEPDKLAIIYFDSIQTLFQDKDGKLISCMEPITFTIFGKERLTRNLEWRNSIILCPFCNQYVYVDWLYHLAYHRDFYQPDFLI